MQTEIRADLPEPIRKLVSKIESGAEKSDDHTIEVAMHLLELRNHIEAGELGDVSWYTWVHENVRLRKTRLRALLRIAESDDPRIEAAYQRELNAKRQAKFRDGQVKLRDLSPEWQSVIRWAKKASAEDAEHVLRVIRMRSQLAVPRPRNHAADQPSSY